MLEPPSTTDYALAIPLVILFAIAFFTAIGLVAFATGYGFQYLAVENSPAPAAGERA